MPSAMSHQAHNDFDGHLPEVTTTCRNHDDTLFGLCVRSSSATGRQGSVLDGGKIPLPL